MRVLVCGDRNWTDATPVVGMLLGLLREFEERDAEDLTVIEGGAKGADLIAAQWAAIWPVNHEQYPADWNRYGKAAGPIRNQQMLDEGKPEEVWAFHDNIQNSKGTRDMCERAAKTGIPVYVVSHYRSETGFDRVGEAVRQARGGDAPVNIQGYA